MAVHYHFTCKMKISFQMDSWSVILNGSVEVTQKGKQPETMHLGDAFGVKTVPDKICHKGIMKTRVDDCQVRLMLGAITCRAPMLGVITCRTSLAGFVYFISQSMI